MVDIGMELIKMEKAALDRWGKGDPDGFLEICAPDVVYFDPYREERVDGLKALTALMETIRGQVYLDRFELINPLVQVSGEQPLRWNCTEAYRREPDGQWRIIQTHWSYTNVFKYHKS